MARRTMVLEGVGPFNIETAKAMASMILNDFEAKVFEANVPPSVGSPKENTPTASEGTFSDEDGMPASKV